MIYLARLIGALVGALASWLAAKYIFLQFLVEPENLAALIALCVGVTQVVYSLVHKKIDKYINPGDSATQRKNVAAELNLPIKG